MAQRDAEAQTHFSQPIRQIVMMLVVLIAFGVGAYIAYPRVAPVFLSNRAGGVLGGISTGQAVTARVAFKPTSSILTPRRTITRDGEETEIMTKGRHDPCVALRAVPVVEAMAACVLADAMLRHRAQVG